jgi:hypothetical protein
MQATLDVFIFVFYLVDLINNLKHAQQEVYPPFIFHNNSFYGGACIVPEG